MTTMEQSTIIIFFAHVPCFYTVTDSWHYTLGMMRKKEIYVVYIYEISTDWVVNLHATRALKVVDGLVLREIFFWHEIMKIEKKTNVEIFIHFFLSTLYRKFPTTFLLIIDWFEIACKTRSFSRIRKSEWWQQLMLLSLFSHI